jgi:hypothetical protein
MPSSSAQQFHTIAVVVALVVIAGILAFVIVSPGVVAQRPPGVVQPTEIKIAPEISGRLLRLRSPRDKASARAILSPSYPTPNSKPRWCWHRRSSGKRAPHAIASMPARARNKSTRSRAISTWRTQICFTHSSNSAEPRNLRRQGSPRTRDLDKSTAVVETANANLARAKERYEAVPWRLYS